MSPELPPQATKGSCATTPQCPGVAFGPTLDATGWCCEAAPCPWGGHAARWQPLQFWREAVAAASRLGFFIIIIYLIFF
jgi:hypothetical protein